MHVMLKDRVELTQRIQRFCGADEMAPIKSAIDRVLSADAKIKERAAVVSNDNNKTVTGKRNDLKKFIADNAPEVVRGRIASKNIRERIEKWKARLLPKPPDKTDLVRAVENMEIRATLAKMKPAERLALLMSKDVDQRFLDAALLAPNEMTGINNNERAMLVDHAIEKAYPGVLARIDRFGDALDMLDTMTRLTEMEAKQVAGIPDNAFEQFLTEAVGSIDHVKADVESELGHFLT